MNRLVILTMVSYLTLYCASSLGANADVEVQNALSTQHTLLLNRQCLSLTPKLASQLDIQIGMQVKLVRAPDNSSMYTACEVRIEDADYIVRTALTSPISFNGTIDTQLTANLLRSEAEKLGALIETSSLSQDGDNTYIVLAPYGGDIKLNTERQAQILSAKDGFKNTWTLAGFSLQGSAYTRWPIEHSTINEASFPKLRELVSHVTENGAFKLGIIFDAWDRKDIVIQGSASLVLRQEIATAIANAINDATIKVVAYDRQDPAHSRYNISAENNVTLNRLAKQSLIIKQGYLARETYYQEITDALHFVLVSHRGDLERIVTDDAVNTDIENLLTATNNKSYQIIYGTNAQDTLYAGNTDDVMYGKQDNDILLGNLGDDIIYGGDAIDRIYGGQGDDLIFGGPGNDIIIGGIGVDTIFVGKGDIVFGSGGVDIFVLLPGAGKYQILDLSESESTLLYLSPKEIDSLVAQITSLGGNSNKKAITIGLKQEVSALNSVEKPKAQSPN
jgi:hypothetical protein